MIEVGQKLWGVSYGKARLNKYFTVVKVGRKYFDTDAGISFCLEPFRPVVYRQKSDSYYGYKLYASKDQHDSEIRKNQLVESILSKKDKLHLLSENDLNIIHDLLCK